MRFLDFVIFLLLAVFLVGGVYFLWTYFPSEPTPFDKYVSNFSEDFPENSIQFNPNMRYSDKRIGYSVSESCSNKKKNDFLDAVILLESKTVLDFYESSKPEIIISCSNIAPEPDEEGHFVAGEGGPSVIINSTNFAVITLGKIALFKPESCDTPQVAAHELLHALGFDHNSNKDSIMYPVTNCDQTIDGDIVTEINRLYNIPSAADLVIENIEATKSGRYLNFEIIVANRGLKGVRDSVLKISTRGEVIKEFDMEDLSLGSRKSLAVTNLQIPRGSDSVSFEITTPENEISNSNNFANIALVEE